MKLLRWCKANAMPVIAVLVLRKKDFGRERQEEMPLLRSVLFGMPPLFPTAIAMCFELMTYGFVAGFLYNRSRWQCVIALYRSMIASMVAGRLVWGVAQIVLLGLSGSAFTLQAFMAGALLNAIPGIVLQLLLIPAIMVALNRTGLVPFKQTKAVSETNN